MIDFDVEVHRISEDPELCERFMASLASEMLSDDAAPSKSGRAALRAYLESDVSGFVTALCGWSLRSVLARTNLIPDEEGVNGPA